MSGLGHLSTRLFDQLVGRVGLLLAELVWVLLGAKVDTITLPSNNVTVTYYGLPVPAQDDWGR